MDALNAELGTATTNLAAITRRIESNESLSSGEQASAEADDRVKPLLADMARLKSERDAAPAGSEAATAAATALAAVERQHQNLIGDIARLNRESARRAAAATVATLQDRRVALERALRIARGEPEPSPAMLASSALRLVQLDDAVAIPTPESPDSDAPALAPANQVDTIMSTNYIFDKKLDKWVEAKQERAAVATTAPAAEPVASEVRADQLLDESAIPTSYREKYSVADILRLAGPDIADGALDGKLTELLEVDYRDLIAGKSLLNVVIWPNDFVNVVPPPTGVVYIDGEIARPGPYDLPASGQLTLSRLVAAAGGLGPLAIPERVDLVRRVDGDREATIRVNLAAIRERTEPDIALKSDDHVIIGTNFLAQPLAVIRNGFRMTYGFGFLIDRNWGTDIFGPPPESLSVN